MKNISIKNLFLIVIVMCAALNLSACKPPAANSNVASSNVSGNHAEAVNQPSIYDKMDDKPPGYLDMDAGAITEAYGAHRNLPRVQGSGIVVKVLKDDTKGLKHQKFLLEVSPSITILIAHNIDLAPRIENLRAADKVEFSGEYIYTPKGGTVHWTHKDPNGHHQAGWLKHNGKTYE